MTSCILITGGFGGLGLLVAEHLARKGPVNLVLTGVSAFDASKEQRLAFLRQLGAGVLYVCADVCDVQSMQRGLAQVREVFGPIHGVIHAAGLAGVKPIFDKDIEDFQKVLDPKITGAQVLDEVLASEPLEYVCYFSSISGKSTKCRDTSTCINCGAKSVFLLYLIARFGVGFSRVCWRRRGSPSATERESARARETETKTETENARERERERALSRSLALCDTRARKIRSKTRAPTLLHVRASEHVVEITATRL